MLTKRIIPCLDIRNGQVVKGKQFRQLTFAGNPLKLAEQYNADGADELVFLDISATQEKRQTCIELVRKVAKKVFIPLTVGGGIRTVSDIQQALAAGADKVSINSAAVQNPTLISQAAERFGSQAVVVAIDAKRKGKKWVVTIQGGKKETKKDVLEWAQEAAESGAGEILLTSMDQDGTKKGFDLELTRKVSSSVRIPVIASGGARNPADFLQVLTRGEADAALAASIFHYREFSIPEVKAFLRKNNVPVRP